MVQEMIQIDKDKLIKIKKLNKAELVAFKLFLHHERNRHIEDIDMIDSTLNEIR